MNVLPRTWETGRLVMSDGVLDDRPQFDAIAHACAYVGEWDPAFRVQAVDGGQPPARDEDLVAKSLGLVARPDPRFRLQSIRLKLATTIIGYFHLYHATPTPQTIFLSMLILHPDYQHQGFGQEVIAGLAHQLEHLGYIAIWLDVYLKNWPALRFWISTGFTTIVEYDGDKRHADDAYALLVLEKKLG